MESTVDPSIRSMPLTGLPLAIFVLSSIFWVLSVITVSLRTYARVRKHIFGLDDIFIVAGTIAYTAATGLSNYGVLVGLGRMNKDLNAWQQSTAMKYYIIWILVYVVALATVKSSICITIMRIASMKANLRYTVYALLSIVWASFFITFIGTLLYCRPVSAIWLPQLIMSGKGSCAPVDTFIIIAHTATVSTIVTDLALVVVPGVILWNTQMKKQAKLQAFGLLSFASVASIITMVRIPFVNRFEDSMDLPFWVAHIILCSNIETGIGCVASSVPSLRHIFRIDASETASGPSRKQRSGGASKSFFTIGSEPRERSRRGSFRNPTDIGFSLSTVTNGKTESWERLHDGDSYQSDAALNPIGGIHKAQEYTVNSETWEPEEEKRGRSGS